MVTIRKGDHSLRVTQGAFLRLYKPMGYTVDGAEGDTLVPPAPDGVGTTPDADDSIKDDSEDDEDESSTGSEDDDEETEEESEPEDDLDEKPISEMSTRELRRYAENLGIETEGLNSRNKLLRAIREYEDE